MEKSLNKSVLLGFSGGADSTAAVLLLRKQGYTVTGLNFSTLPANDNSIKEKDFISAVAAQLSMPLLFKDVSSAFDNKVISAFCNDYKSGRTPNPCIMCNPLIKFSVLEKTADELGIENIATGHYARVFNSTEDFSFVRRARSEKKDQSYMLYRLSSRVLKRVIFPLGEMESKESTRKLLRSKDMMNAETKDSQDICFVKEGSYKDFLANRMIDSPFGNFIDKDNNILGIHHGLINYTIGQRKGLEKTFGKPMYVVKMNQDENTVTLGEESELYKTDVYFDHAFYTQFEDCGTVPAAYENLEVYAKLRYTAKPSKATLLQDSESRPFLRFFEPQRAPTPGQSAVFYREDVIIGGGIIL